MKQKKYNIIYADPPWTFRVYSPKGNGRSAAIHYPTMNLEAIKDLPVEQLADRDCTLFLWVTFPNLRESFEVIRSWGFTFKTVAFVWIKQNRKSESLFWGMGYWTRANAEICLLATKGSPKRQSAGVHQVIISHVEEHSKKPAEARERIVKLMGDLPRIELFARQQSPGWDVWGNEVESSLDMGKLQENRGKEKVGELCSRRFCILHYCFRLPCHVFLIRHFCTCNDTFLVLWFCSIRQQIRQLFTPRINFIMNSV